MRQIDDLTNERNEFRRRLAAQQEIATDAAKERDQAAADAAVSGAAADGLSRQVAALVADVRRAGAAAGSSATGDALGKEHTARANDPSGTGHAGWARNDQSLLDRHASLV
ncbi:MULTISPECIES: hypothetical protein [Burkholderia]|uniref:hypothetical protein n=1 Tax=Burkholderia TaxID=32008 RepID=UPI000AA6E75C|nr:MULTISPECIES: hypothetical protein [Burkholderia]